MSVEQQNAGSGEIIPTEKPLGFLLYAGAVTGLAFFWQFFRYTNILSVTPANIEFLTGAIGSSPALIFYFFTLVLAIICVFAKTVFSRLIRISIVGVIGLLASTCLVVVLSGEGTWGPEGFLIVVQACTLILFSLSFVLLTAAWAKVCARIAAHDLRRAVYCLCVSCLASFVISFGLFSLSPFSQYFIAVVPAVSSLLLVFVTRRMSGAARPQLGGTQSSASSPKGIVIFLVTLLVLTIFVKGLCDTLFTETPENMLILKHFITIVELVVIMSVCLFTVSVNKLAFLGWIVLTGGLVSGLVFLFFADSSFAQQIGLGTITAAKTCFELFVFVMVVVDRRLGDAPRMALALVVIPETISYLVGYGLLPSLAHSFDFVLTNMMGSVSLGLAVAIVISAFVIISSLALKSFDATAAGGVAPEAGAVSARKSVEGKEQAGLGSGPDGGAVTLRLSEETADIEKRFKELSQEFGLTKRERETSLLVFKGYSAKRIAEIQYVSLNTVQSHTRNVYRKLNIHSRQDLIDVVEGRLSPASAKGQRTISS